MLFPYRINASNRSEQARCSIKPTGQGYGFCQGARSCAECPRAKLDHHSPERIEAGDTVRTTAGESLKVISFEVRRGFLTGYVWLRSKKGLRRFLISAITLHSKYEAHKQSA